MAVRRRGPRTAAISPAPDAADEPERGPTPRWWHGAAGRFAVLALINLLVPLILFAAGALRGSDFHPREEELLRLIFDSPLVPTATVADALLMPKLPGITHAGEAPRHPSFHSDGDGANSAAGASHPSLNGRIAEMSAAGVHEVAEAALAIAHETGPALGHAAAAALDAAEDAALAAAQRLLQLQRDRRRSAEDHEKGQRGKAAAQAQAQAQAHEKGQRGKAAAQAQAQAQAATGETREGEGEGEGDGGARMWPGAHALRAAWRSLFPSLSSSSWSSSPAAAHAGDEADEPAAAPRSRRAQTASSAGSPASADVDGASSKFPQEVLVFRDEFLLKDGALNTAVWRLERTMGGGGNAEQQLYDGNSSLRHVVQKAGGSPGDGVLVIAPRLTSDLVGAACIEGRGPEVVHDAWGTDPASLCTAPQWWGCMRTSGAGKSEIPPLRSARLSTATSFGFRYGRVEARMRLPRGDWLWPAFWMLPVSQAYGGWPASGEIDIMESRGNDPSYPAGGRDTSISTLHWGPDYASNAFEQTSRSQKSRGGRDFSEDFHVYGLIWGPDRLQTYIDSPSNVVLDVPFAEEGGVAGKGFWERGRALFGGGRDNPWAGGSHASPFDRDFYIIINVAVAGGFFPPNVGGRPWATNSPNAARDLWAARERWLPTWGWVRREGAGGGAGWAPPPGPHPPAAMEVDYVRVWQPRGSHAPRSGGGGGGSGGGAAKAPWRYATLWPASYEAANLTPEQSAALKGA